MNTSTTLVFQNTTFDIIDRNSQPWLRSPQIAVALGYNRADRVNELYARNSNEFTESMTSVVKLHTAGGEQETRIFSLRGVHLLAMFAKTEIAKEFRRWVLDILDRETAQSPYSSNPTDTLTLEQCDQLRDMMRSAADGMLSQDAGKFMMSGWSKLKAHFGVAYRKIPQHKFSDALAIVSRHVADHAAKQLPPPAAPLLGQRILTRLEEGGRYTSQIISPTAYIFEMDELDAFLKRAGKMIVPIEAVRALQNLTL